MNNSPSRAVIFMSEVEPQLGINPDLEAKDPQVMKVPKRLRLERGLSLDLMGFSIHRPAKVFPYQEVLAALIDQDRSRLLVSTTIPVENGHLKPYEALMCDADTDINFTYFNPRTLEVTTFNLPHLIALMRR